MTRIPILLFLTFTFFISYSQDWQSLTKLFEEAQKKGLIDSMLYYSTEALKKAELVHGKNSKYYIQSLNNYALSCHKKGLYSQAEKCYLESIELRKSIFGEKHINVANGLNSLAGLYLDVGNYQKAEELYNDALKIYKEQLTEKHQYYANTLFNLGRAHFLKGNYSMAEPCYLKAIEITKELKNDNTINFAQFMNDIAVLYRKLGNYEKTTNYYELAIDIYKKNNKTNNPDYLRILNNLASIYNDLKEYSKAENLYLEIYSLQKKLLGTKHPDYIVTLNNIAALYNNSKQYEKAQPFLEEAILVGGETVGKQHPYYASTLSHLASLAIAKKELSEAEKYLLQSHELKINMFGKQHPISSKSQYDLAILYFELKNYEKSEFYFKELIKSRLYQIRKNFEFLSEDEKEKYWRTIKDELDVFFSFSLERIKTNPSITMLLYDMFLNTRGILFNSSYMIRNAIINSKNEDLLKKYDEWVKLKNILGQLSIAKPEDILNKNINKDSIEARANLLEKELSKQTELLAQKNNQENVNWNTIKEKLEDNEILIDFVEFKLFKNFNFEDSTIYAALITSKEMNYPLYIRICNESDIVKFLENTISNTPISDYVFDTKMTKDFYNTLWKPLEQYLKNKKRIFITLSGILNKVSIPILKNSNNEMLLDNYELCFLNHPKNILKCKEENSVRNKEILIYGGINYNIGFSEMIKKASIYVKDLDSKVVNIDSSGVNTGLWDYLPGTLEEAEIIQKLLKTYGWQCIFLKEAEANEESFKYYTTKNTIGIIHLATHGFFFSNEVGKTDITRNSFESNNNPLFRSGIIFAGGNNAWQNKKISGIDDGILTAYEVSICNLLNTDLVVLSACETGLGDIKSGEGVYGLQRAFQIAGAKSLIMSLWNVPDKETIELMSLFYENLVKTGNIRKSFINAQREMKKKYDPLYWGGFILIE